MKHTLCGTRLLRAVLSGFFCLVQMLAPGDEGKKTPPDELFHMAKEEAARGERLEAADKFRRAADDFAAQKNPAREAASLYNFALCCHHLGNYQLAYGALDRALAAAEASKSEELRSQIAGLSGTISTFAMESAHAQENLERSLAEARERKDDHTTAWLLNDLGVLLASKGDLLKARERLDESSALASKQAMAELKVRALVNKMLASLNKWHRLWQEQRVLGEDNPFYADVLTEQESWFTSAIEDAGRAQAAATELSESYDHALCLVTLADAWRALGRSPRAPPHQTQKKTFETLTKAVRMATVLDIKPLLCQSLGMMAELYREAARIDEAMKVNETALRLADEQGVVEDLFRWEWQRGRLLVAKGRRDDALNAYERAYTALTRVRHDVAVGYGNKNLGQTFREAVGAMFFEHADLVLSTADGEKDDAKLQIIYARARDLAEELKTAELVDYFQDACLNLLRAKDKKVVNLDTGDAAIIYAMPFRDRTELLVTHRGRTERFRAPITDEELEITAMRWRRDLETLGSLDHMTGARRLHDALIQPLEAHLQKSGVKTLVFVPDGALRLVPMAALHDGSRYLVERYAISVIPGMQLTDPSPVTREGARMLLGALTQARQDFPPLPAVEKEVVGISKVLPVELLKDDSFLKNTFTTQAASNVFRIMHIASHGEFRQDSADTFVLTYDDKIRLNELEGMIRPRRYEDVPVELLCLSACKTATGDDRAALGLAGVAVKCGARAALASLWYVSDEVTSLIMTDFYKRLFADPKLSKAEALCQAQIAVLKDVRFNHPAYWAPYLLIGNWL